MADDADVAFDLVEARVSVGLAAVVGTIDPGNPGICAECDEPMPRLVGGRCAFCRDGRLPPPSFYENRIPARPVSTAPVGASSKENAVTTPNTANSRSITVPARGAVLAAIEKVAEEHELPLGQAAIRLIEDGFARETATAEAALSSLSGFGVGELLDELRERLDRADDEAALATAVKRAEAAEGKLAALRELIAG